MPNKKNKQKAAFECPHCKKRSDNFILKGFTIICPKCGRSI